MDSPSFYFGMALLAFLSLTPFTRLLHSRPLTYLLAALWFAWLGFTDLLLTFLVPLKLVAPTLVYHASSKLAFTVWAYIQFIFTHCNGAEIEVSGDNLPPLESAVVIANHISWTDFYMIQKLAYDSGMLGRCRYFAKQQLRWVPFLGWALWAMGFPLLSRNWQKDQKQLDRMFDGIVEKGWPTCTFPPSHVILDRKSVV